MEDSSKARPSEFKLTDDKPMLIRQVACRAMSHVSIHMPRRSIRRVLVAM